MMQRMLKKVLLLFREKTSRTPPIKMPAASAIGKYFNSINMSFRMYIQVC